MISAVVPVFNSEKTLKRAVDSLLLQPEIDEIFLVEDGSVDQSLRLCHQLAQKHPCIQVLQHPDGLNKGAPESRNLGLQASKNEWIQFMDADDQLLPGKISSQVAMITGEEDLLVGQFKYIDRDGSSTLFTPIKDVWSGLIATRLGYTSSNLWRKSAMIRAGEWDPNLINIQEYNLIFSMLKTGARIKFSDQALTKIYYQPDSIGNSPQNETEKRDHYFIFREKIRAYLVENNMFTLRRRHYFNSITGLMLRYHRPDFKVNLDNTYFRIYSAIRDLRKKSF
ncbi:glycosyltransferase family 2 protein [Algoriphagus sp. A40]|uniref:glycosyltransferase family 2 protein n=1 Tax=Algoriphagus sp. A40 TaxID=1945863 RepID=UPI0009CE90C4|nr:glycosyltransferase family 2 protein [Algoriphagus sp. A40]OOG69891.1 hypothetical protein B0E43_19720 [Algoriphagus sp. A40]